MKKLVLILVILFLSNCGFTPIYNNQENIGFEILIEKIDGDKSINNILEKKLKRYSNNETGKIYIINVQTTFNKDILSKDKTGRATDLKLSTNVNFTVKYENQIKEFSFNENLNIDSSSNFYEQNNYENDIKNNFVNTIVDKLIVKLKLIK
tara:strand:- start:18 stop:470 length:453 start_codon:yes stop_codon:yes gene_type:complete